MANSCQVVFLCGDNGGICEYYERKSNRARLCKHRTKQGRCNCAIAWAYAMSGKYTNDGQMILPEVQQKVLKHLHEEGYL